MPTKAQKVSRYTLKNSAGPKARAKSAISGGRKVSRITCTSAPMITPRITPVNMSARLVGVSATLKPCIRDWISSIASAQAQQPLERALGQRHEEPHLEDQEQNDAVAYRDRAGLPP